MRVLLIHNRYQIRGGEDVCYDNEVGLLRENGFEVREYLRDNRDITSDDAGQPLTLQTPPPHPPRKRGGGEGVGLALRTIWSNYDYRELRAVMREFQPDVAHVHNYFPLISPALFHAAYAEGVPVVQTLHNYRLLCPAANLFRDGRVCEECVGQTPPLPAVVYKCYRNSRGASAAVAAMLTFHRARRTFQRRVNLFIALTEFQRRKMIAAGLHEKRVVVKPNFLHPDPGYGRSGDGYALYAGRLSPEKGIATLTAAWRELGGEIPLKIVGEGPAEDGSRNIPGVEWLGIKSHNDVYDLLRGALCLVIPSLCYECLPMALIEAFAVGTPVLASRIGSLASLIRPDATGRLFTPGDARDLAKQARWAAANRDALKEMGREARREFEQRYTAAANLQMLTGIYQALATGAGSE